MIRFSILLFLFSYTSVNAFTIYNHMENDISAVIEHKSCYGGRCHQEPQINVQGGVKAGYYTEQELPKGAKITVKVDGMIDGTTKCKVPENDLGEGDYYQINIRPPKMAKLSHKQLKCEVKILNKADLPKKIKNKEKNN